MRSGRTIATSSASSDTQHRVRRLGGRQQRDVEIGDEAAHLLAQQRRWVAAVRGSPSAGRPPRRTVVRRAASAPAPAARSVPRGRRRPGRAGRRTGPAAGGCRRSAYSCISGVGSGAARRHRRVGVDQLPGLRRVLDHRHRERTALGGVGVEQTIPPPARGRPPRASRSGSRRRARRCRGPAPGRAASGVPRRRRGTRARGGRSTRWSRGSGTPPRAGSRRRRATARARAATRRARGPASRRGSRRASAGTPSAAAGPAAGSGWSGRAGSHTCWQSGVSATSRVSSRSITSQSQS